MILIDQVISEFFSLGKDKIFQPVFLKVDILDKDLFLVGILSDMHFENKIKPIRIQVFRNLSYE